MMDTNHLILEFFEDPSLVQNIYLGNSKKKKN